MCGICGLVEPRSPERDARLGEMRGALRHRGPDDEAGFADDAAALGFARLAIIDLEGGRQPMTGEDGRFTLVLNGEIYNYRELARELAHHRFRSRCDAEVALHAFEEWGERSVERLDGMFAFAVWDARDRALFLARDVFGKKPLAYRHDGARFAFASELHALGRGPVARAALERYLTYGYVPPDLAFCEGLGKLPPGHWLRFRDGRVTVQRYAFPRARGAVRPIREALDRAVAKRLVADVPLGAFLSGGLDSTIVVGLMSRHQKVKTFSIGFDEPEFDELRFARAAAERFGTEHHEHVVRVDAVEVLPSLVRHFGEPFGDPSAVPTFYVARETRRHVKVALSGDGGDEAFGGYLRHLAVRKLKSLKPVGWAVKMLSPLYRPGKYGARARRVLARIDRPLWQLYRDLVSVFPDEPRAALIGPDATPDRQIEELFATQPDPVSAAGWTDLHTYLPGDLLVKVDICSMANGLEVRCPFLDPAVVDAAFALPGAAKIRGDTTKAVLRREFADLLPPAIAKRGKKGFGVPVDRWLRGPLRDALHDLLLDHTALGRGLFDPGEVERLVREHDSGTDHGARLWLLLVFELWTRAV